MVDDPSEYVWSSYRCNGLGVRSTLCKPHPEYWKLGKTAEERLFAYRELFKAQIEGALLRDVRSSVNKRLALGSERFKEEIEMLHGRRVRPAKMGRPSVRNVDKIKSCT